MLRVAIVHSGGAYAERVIEYLSSPPEAKVLGYQVPADLPPMMDEEDAAAYLPAELADADVVVAINLHTALLSELPYVMSKGTAKALLVPREDPSWVRPGLVQQVTRSCARFGIESAFPKPFCSLQPLTPLLAEFCDQYRVGRHRFTVHCRDGLIADAHCLSSSGCGLTAWVVEQLVGERCDDSLPHRAAELLHLRPCLASMALDDEDGDTIMHHAIAIIEQASRDALAEKGAHQS